MERGETPLKTLYIYPMYNIINTARPDLFLNDLPMPFDKAELVINILNEYAMRPKYGIVSAVKR
jgi:hypothetical protein